MQTLIVKGLGDTMFRQPQGKKLLSDHMSYIAETNNITLIGWNILNSMQFNEQWKFFNNGFNCAKESNELFLNRLSHIASQLGHAVVQKNPDFICLQECPETQETRLHFEKEIMKNALKDFGMVYSNNDVYLITFYNKQSYAINPELTEKMGQTFMQDGLASRVLPLVFTNLSSSEVVLIINVHGKFPKDIKNDVKALHAKAKELGIINIVLIGDFNRDLVTQSDAYSKHDISASLDAEGRFDGILNVNAVSSSSFCSVYNKESGDKSQGIETRDGIMSTFPAKIACLVETNSVDLALSFSNPVAPELSSIPNGFLEQLKENNIEINYQRVQCQ